MFKESTRRERLLRKHRRSCGENIKLDYKETDLKGVDWNHLALDRDRWLPFVNTTVNLQVP
jgi:hypothetical protein